MINQFKETLKIFREFAGYSEPITFESWASINNTDTQLAFLYCQFYDSITLAWYKGKAEYVTEEEGVSCVLQYLLKNVPIIQKSSKRFNPAYIYTVAYNCIYCLREVQRDINRYNYETTNIQCCNDGEIDLCDLVPHRDKDYISEKESELFWAIIKDMGIETEKVVNHLLNGESLRKTSKRCKSYSTDPLRDISVSKVKMGEIVEQLKLRLSRFKEVYY